MKKNSPKSATTATQAPQSPQSAESATLFARAIDLGQTACVITDDAGQILAWSLAAARLFGWSAAEMIGQRLNDRVLPGDLPRNDAGTSGEAKTSPRQMQANRNGAESFPAEIEYATMADDGRLLRVHFIRDITEQLAAKRQLLQAQKLEAIGHLTSGLAHDFNNLLGIIIGSLDLLREEPLTTEGKELLDAALVAARRGTQITQSMLAVARKRALAPQATNINLLIDELMPLLHQSAGRQITITFAANALSPWCEIDAGALSNALVNLVINAHDAMPGGGEILVYSYTTAILPDSLSAPPELRPGNYAVIGVDDSGPGMTADVAMRAFDPFFTTKPRGQGTGLGLSMVYAFARQSGGTARVQSTLGRGTSIQLLLPIVGTAETKPSPAQRNASSAARILLVLADKALERLAREALQAVGHGVTSATTGEEALIALDGRRFDLLLADTELPGTVDGLALSERCRSLYPTLPVILAATPADSMQVTMRTHRPVLEKPCTPTTVLAKCGEMIATVMSPP